MTLAFKDIPPSRAQGGQNTPQTYTISESNNISSLSDQAPSQCQGGQQEDEDEDDDPDPPNDPEDANAPLVQNEDAPKSWAAWPGNEVKMTNIGTSEQAGLPDETSTMQCEDDGLIDFRDIRRPSISEISGSVSDGSEFDVADDDDDYAAVDQISQCDNDDANLEELESHHHAAKFHDKWIQAAPEVVTVEPIEPVLNWDDHTTYDFEYSFPYSASFPAESPIANAMTLDHIDTAQNSNQPSLSPAEALTSATLQYDPHMVQALFSDDMSTSGDDSSETTGPPGKVSPSKQVDTASPSVATGAVDDTDSEDLTEEIERRRRLSESRQRRKMSVNNRSRSHRKSRSLSVTHASKIQKFTRTPRKIHAAGRMTTRGRMIYLSISDRTRINWVTGRVPVDPATTTPSPELTRHLRSRMFRQAYCPDRSTMEMMRQLSIPRSYWHAVFNQPANLNAGLLLPPASSSDLQSSLSTEDRDFTGYIDEDGEPGLTIFDGPIDLEGDFGGVFDELDEDLTPISHVSSAVDTSLHDVSMQDAVDETPCPTRHRDVDDSQDSPIHEDEFEDRQRLFSSPPPHSNHISV